MWKPHLDFITLHYLYILFLGIIGLIVIYPYGNISAVNAYFFGVSAGTESGLNVVDVNKLALYQQIVIYLVPILGNMQFVSILIVVVRLFWFRRRLKDKADRVPHRAATKPVFTSVDAYANHNDSKQKDELSRSNRCTEDDDGPRESRSRISQHGTTTTALEKGLAAQATNSSSQSLPSPPPAPLRNAATEALDSLPPSNDHIDEGLPTTTAHISFAPDVIHPIRRSTIPPGSDQPLSSEESQYNEKRDHGYGNLPVLAKTHSHESHEASLQSRGRHLTRIRSRGPSPDRISFQRVVSNVFVLGADSDAAVGAGPVLRRTRSGSESRSRSVSRQRKPSTAERLKLSANAIMGRNSNFANLSPEDKDKLGGIEYKSLKLLLKIVLVYYIGLHLLGVICLTGWIWNTDELKYRDYLASCGINAQWWAIYSAQTMSNNLGFTLTPDSMISFRDAVFPVTVMTILAYCGHTFYPIMLRLLIWTLTKVHPKHARIQQPLQFLLDHPRRCYTLLFPARPTWILAGILIALNIVDVILIICLDLDNPEVTAVPLAPRIMSSIFQAASSRHTGTSTFNLANVNPGVQFSLLVMMYVSIFPIALSVRSSNTYEETSLGIYEEGEEAIESPDGKSYLRAHVRNQLSFDLWYIFLGCFCICCSEAEKLMDTKDPAFAVFPIFFEVTSAYANVGLSLGHPSVMTSFSGKFNAFSKLVICAMMIRGRHRGLPVRLDRAITLPSERFSSETDEEERMEGEKTSLRKLPKLKQFHTQ